MDTLEILNLSNSSVYDISFLVKNKNIKELIICGACIKKLRIKDFTPISQIERLEILKLAYTNIDNISFLANNENIKYLDLHCALDMRDCSPTSN